eukprot:jgi/Mesvir1/9416/Mv01518-RA.1
MAQSSYGDTTLTKVFVGGLAWETSTETMRRHFETYGEIVEAVVIMDRNTGRSKGYGFVTFKDADAAARATADPSPVIDGRRANCNLASQGSKRASAGGGGGGGGGPPAGPGFGATGYHQQPPQQSAYGGYPPQHAYGYQPYGYDPHAYGAEQFPPQYTPQYAMYGQAAYPAYAAHGYAPAPGAAAYAPQAYTMPQQAAVGQQQAFSMMPGTTPAGYGQPAPGRPFAGDMSSAPQTASRFQQQY